MSAGSWLFTRGPESIHIVRQEGGRLTVEGPGAKHQQHRFDTEDAIQRFQVTLAEELSEAGWLLFGVDRERRTGRERRTTGRGPDRRNARAARHAHA
ncbi:MAG: hypothetical protein AB7G23_01560 [Vicinamibacterales bacterium]